MVDLLKRSLAPLTQEAWTEIDAVAVRVMKAHLSARTIVDFEGPHGWSLGAVNLGRLEIAKKPSPGGVPWGIRNVLPLIEVRIGFRLTQLELDNVSRGCKDPNLEPLEDAARKVALFEESAVYKGFADGQIQGIIEQSSHKPVKLPGDPRRYPQAVSQGIKELSLAGVAGPYALVLGTDPFYALMQSGESGYPPRRIIRDMLHGEIVWSPALEGGLLLSTRGGDFELVVGQDLSVGYASHDRDNVDLFLTESFTFRVLEPAAAVELKVAAQ
jgi:uncharacterized linocin/CFP29 family protein